MSLKRPELIVRRTTYRGVVVDERLLTDVYPWVPRPPTLQLFVLLAGRVEAESRDGTSRVSLRPGEAVLLSPADQSLLRYAGAELLDLEWTPAGAAVGPAVRALGPVDRERAVALGERVARGEDDARVLADALQFFGEIGAPIAHLSVTDFQGGPSERDVRIARAIGAQLEDLRTTATALSFGERAELSPRQLQRILADFCARYRMNATNWRDMRNRYRLQMAIVLASVPGISVKVLASEVGYQSSTALARAFAQARLPSPAVLCERLGGSAEPR